MIKGRQRNGGGNRQNKGARIRGENHIGRIIKGKKGKTARSWKGEG